VQIDFTQISVLFFPSSPQQQQQQTQDRGDSFHGELPLRPANQAKSSSIFSFVASSSISVLLLFLQLGGRGRHQPTNEQRTEIREAFDLFDTDKSGNVCVPRVVFFFSLHRFPTMNCDETCDSEP
jgi:hypothetical protein